MRTRWIVGGVATGVGILSLCAYGFYQNLNASFQIANTISDPRACMAMGDNNIGLDQAASEFALKFPADATDLEFTANVDFFGHLDLNVRFKTTPQGVAMFVKQAGLPPPTPYTGSLDGDGVLIGTFPDACGLTPVDTGRLYFTKSYDSGITLVVNEAVPAHPVVYIDAEDS